MAPRASLYSVHAAQAWTWRLRALLGGLALALIGLLVWQDVAATRAQRAEQQARIEQAHIALDRVSEEVQGALDDLAAAFSGTYAAEDMLGVGLAVRRGRWRAATPYPELLASVCVQPLDPPGEGRALHALRCLGPDGWLRPASSAQRALIGADPLDVGTRARTPALVVRRVGLGRPVAHTPAESARVVRPPLGALLRPPVVAAMLERARRRAQPPGAMIQELYRSMRQNSTGRAEEAIVLELDARVLAALPERLLQRYLGLLRRAEVTIAQRVWSPMRMPVPYVLLSPLGDGQASVSSSVNTSAALALGAPAVRAGVGRSWMERTQTSLPVFALDATLVPMFEQRQARRLWAGRGLRMAAGLLVLGLLGLVYLAARRAQSLAEERMAFAAAVSHELRTPVAAVLTAAENLRDGVVTDPAGVARYGALLADEAARLRRTVEQTLALARPDTLSERTDVDLVALARAVVARAQAQHPAQPLHVGAVAPAPVWGDAAALDGALANLVENAVKYGQGQPVRVVVRGTPTGAEVQVEDHGIGLAEGEAARVFEPFYRSARAQAVASGVGLGLTLVRRVAEAHGGAVAAEARVGGGAVFTLTIPAGKS